MSRSLSFFELSAPLRALLFYGVSVLTDRARPIPCHGTIERWSIRRPIIRKFKRCSGCGLDFESNLDDANCHQCQDERVRRRYHARRRAGRRRSPEL